MKHVIIMILSAMACSAMATITGPDVRYYDRYDYTKYTQPGFGYEIFAYDTYYCNGVKIFNWYNEYQTIYGSEVILDIYYWPQSGTPYIDSNVWIDGVYYHQIVANTMTFPAFEYKYWRDDRTINHSDGSSTHIELYIDCEMEVKATNEGQGTKPNHLFPFYASATKFVYNETTHEFDNTGFVPSSSVTVGGNTLDSNSRSHKLLSYDQMLIDVTPRVSNCNNYEFLIDRWNVTRDPLSKTHHPLLSNPIDCLSLQSKYNDTSISVLATDNDNSINDFSETLRDEDGSFSDLYRWDDVPAYDEFFVNPASPETFPTPFQAANYLEPDDAKVTELLQASFSNIMIVNDLPGNKLGISSGSASLFKASAISNTPKVLLHEWLHTKGVSHRGTLGNPSVCGITNNEACGDTGALMYYQNSGENNKVNRSERR